MQRGLSVLEQNNPLASLKDIHLPEAVSNFPSAVGWWLLVMIGLLTLLAVVKFGCYLVEKNAYRRVAIKQLQQLQADFSVHNNDLKLLSAVNQLLKSVAIRQFPEQQCEKLHGQSWLQFLSLAVSKSQSVDLQGLVKLNAIYQKEVNLTNQQRYLLLLNAKNWLQKHRKIINKGEHFV